MSFCYQKIPPGTQPTGVLCGQYLKTPTSPIFFIPESPGSINLLLYNSNSPTTTPYGNMYGSVCQCCTTGVGGIPCFPSSSAPVIATQTTVDVTQDAWVAATGTNTSSLNEDISYFAEDSTSGAMYALAQLASSTAGQLAGDDDTDEERIKNAVIIACTLILTHIDKLADSWKSGKKLYIASFTNEDIRANTSTIKKNDTNNLKYTVQNAASILEKTIPLTGAPEQWVTLTGDVTISTQTHTQQLLGSTSKAQTTSSASMFNYETGDTDNYIISHNPQVSVEIGLMAGIADRPYISDIIPMSSEFAYPKTTSTRASESISIADADTGLIIAIIH